VARDQEPGVGLLLIMQFIEEYLSKQHFHPNIPEKPAKGLGICVVIPVFNEPALLLTLESLWACQLPFFETEIIIVVNAPEHSNECIVNQNIRTIGEVNFRIQHQVQSLIPVYVIHYPNMPVANAGVGLARKTGMDEAVYRLNLAGNPNGIIVCFDADSVCDPNYFTEIESHFKQHPSVDGASIYFEHPLMLPDSKMQQGIVQYELHLRYMNQALRYAHHPFAYHTVGSAMAVRMESYVKQGGMNKRKAGEDFYFLQKIIGLGRYGEINTTRVIPSSRVSDRVPFGTGAAMKSWETNNLLNTYNLKAYDDIRYFLEGVQSFYEKADPKISDNASSPFLDYLNSINFEEHIHSIRSNSASFLTFRNRFFQWFSVFKVIKYLNYSHRVQYKKGSPFEESNRLLNKLGFDEKIENSLEMLLFFRKLDRTGFGIQ